MKKTLILILSVLFLSSCVTLLPSEERMHVWIEENTKATAAQAFDRANAYLSTSTKGSDLGALRDKEAKRIVVTYKLRGCAAPGYLATELSPDVHEFKLDIETKDNRVRIRVLDLKSWPAGGDIVFGPRNAEQMKGTVEKCIEPAVIRPLIQAIRRELKSSDW